MQNFLRDTLKNTPILRNLAYAYLARNERHVLAMLKKTPHHQARQVYETLRQLNREFSHLDQGWPSRIESERDRLLGREDILVDGSLGEGGISDEGETIRSACESSKPLYPALLLYLLIREFNPTAVLELGTNVGISSAYIAAALKTNDRGGIVTTLEASPYRQKLAIEVHRNLALDNVTYVLGLFTDTLDSTLQNLGLVDFVFIDGHHQYKPTIDYFNRIWKFSRAGAIFLFDDIRWSRGMKQAWSEIKTDERLGLVVDLHSMGICVGAENRNSGRYVLPPMRIFRERR